MFSLSIRGLPVRLALFSKPAVLQTASYAITRRSREVAKLDEFTRNDADTVEAANDSSNSMDQITDILDSVVMSGSPQSSNFTSELFLISTLSLIFPRCVHSHCKI